MAKYVDKVLVGSTLGTATALADVALGTIQFFDEQKQPVLQATALAGNAFYIGVKNGSEDGDIYFSDKITRDIIDNVTYETFRTFTPASAAITLATPVAGNRYTLRIAYGDVTEMPIQFTQTFDVTAATGETATTLAAKFVNAVNSKTTIAGRNARVIATSTNGVLTLTAKIITVDDKVDSFIYDFHAIEINDASVTCEGASAYTAKVITAEDNGCGYWKIVRDQEKRALAYRGSMFFLDDELNYKGTLNTTINAQYNCLNILYNNIYRSASLQQLDTTPLNVTVYATADLADTFTAIKAWADATKVYSDTATSTTKN